MGTNAISTARPSTRRRSKMPLRGERRDTPSSSIARTATAGYRCRWHRSSGSYSRQSGKTASDTRGTLEPQTRIGPAKLPWGCTVSNWRRDTSGLFRRESEAAAKTAEAMIVQVASGASCIRTRAPCRGGRAACVGGIAACSGGARGSNGGGVEGFTRGG